MSLSTRRSRRRSLATAATIDLTPMVDVVFLLIIFFMLTTTFITTESGLPVDLPEAQSSAPTLSMLPTVTVNQQGQIFLGGLEVAEAELAGLLRAELVSSGQTDVVLRADREVQHGTAVRIMDIIKQAGAQRIAIATGGG